VSVGPVRLEAVMRTLDGSVIVGGAAIRDQQLLVDIGIAMRKQVLARIVELFAAEDRRGT
jgi:hypothetical protein